MKYVLVPTKMPEKVTLYEALIWVGFRTYFISDFERGGGDVREDLDYNQSVLIDSTYVESFFTDEICKKYGFPRNYLPRYYLFSGEGDIDLVGIALQNILSQEFIDEMKKNKLEDDEYIKNQPHFDSALANYLEIPKSELFIAIKKGNIKTFGREILDRLLKTEDYDDEELANLHSLTIEQLFEGHDGSNLELLPIPEKDWNQKNTNWNDSYLKNDANCYCHILVDTESLFLCFPEPEMKAVSVYSHGGFLLIDDKDANLNLTEGVKRGRKNKYKWSEIHAEIIRRFWLGEMPKYQNTFIIEIQEWCTKKWGEELTDPATQKRPIC